LPERRRIIPHLSQIPALTEVPAELKIKEQDYEDEFEHSSTSSPKPRGESAISRPMFATLAERPRAQILIWRLSLEIPAAFAGRD
jgi:hypothetical protein